MATSRWVAWKGGGILTKRSALNPSFPLRQGIGFGEGVSSFGSGGAAIRRALIESNPAPASSWAAMVADADAILPAVADGDLDVAYPHNHASHSVHHSLYCGLECSYSLPKNYDSAFVDAFLGLTKDTSWYGVYSGPFIATEVVRIIVPSYATAASVILHSYAGAGGGYAVEVTISPTLVSLGAARALSSIYSISGSGSSNKSFPITANLTSSREYFLYFFLKPYFDNSDPGVGDHASQMISSNIGLNWS